VCARGAHAVAAGIADSILKRLADVSVVSTSQARLGSRAHEHVGRVRPGPPKPRVNREVGKSGANTVARSSFRALIAVAGGAEVEVSVARARVGAGIGVEALAEMVRAVGTVVP
jgi:hypothetical protein